MRIVHLPSETVDFINSVTRSMKGIDVNLADAVQIYRDTHNAVQRWLDNKSLVILSEEENRVLSIMHFVLGKRLELLNRLENTAPDQAAFEELIKIEFELADNLTTFSSLREKGVISPIPVVNDFLMAAWAHINKETTYETVASIFALLQQYLKNFTDEYNSVVHTLRAEVGQEFATGFRIVYEGMTEVDEFMRTRRKDILDQGCDKIKEGFGILNYFNEWKRDRDLQLFEQFNRFRIPLIGHELEILIREAQEGKTDQWAEKVGIIAISSLPRLEDFWVNAREKLFVRPSRKCEIVGRIDRGLEELRASLIELQKLTAESLQRYEGIIAELSSAFTELDEITLRWGETVVGTGGELLVEATKGAYYGTLPDFILEEMLKFFKSSPQASYQEEVIGCLESYLSEWDHEYLLMALEKFIDTLPPPAAPAAQEEESTIPCTFCGTANEKSRSFCKSCNAKLMLKQAMTYETESRPIDAAIPQNVLELPLPPTAEPLVRLMKVVDDGSCTPEFAAAQVGTFRTYVSKTQEQMNSDKNTPKEALDRLSPILEEFAQASQECDEFLQSLDGEILRRILKKISDASVKAQNVEPPEEMKEKV
jgi:hypothetical protein